MMVFCLLAGCIVLFQLSGDYGYCEVVALLLVNRVQGQLRSFVRASMLRFLRGYLHHLNLLFSVLCLVCNLAECFEFPFFVMKMDGSRVEKKKMLCRRYMLLACVLHQQYKRYSGYILDTSMDREDK